VILDLGLRKGGVTVNVYTEVDGQAQREALRKISNVLRRDGQNGQWMAANWCQWPISGSVPDRLTRWS
jgi:hypothetical protein